jgi:protein ImuB
MLLLDLSGLEHLYPDESDLARKILAGLAEHGFPARLAIADTLGAAWAMARGKENTECKMKSEKCKWQSEKYKRQDTDGPHFAICNLQFTFCTSSYVSSYLIIPPDQSLLALAPLPIGLLRLDDDTVELLGQVGVYQIGQLERLPRAELPARFGPEVLRRLDQALGRAEERLPPLKAPPELSVCESFEYPTTDRDFLAAALRRLIDRLSARLAEHGLGALRLECVFVCRPAEPVRLSVGLFQATASAAHLFGLVEVQLERSRLSEPVENVKIDVAAYDRLERRQQELFADVPPRRHPRHLAALVDRLANRLGHGSVGRPRLVPDAQPELAYRYDPLVATGNGVRNRFPDAKTTPDPFVRPLRLFRRPIPLEVIAVEPDGPPAMLRFHGQAYQIAACWGPERIETGWWRHRAVGRDYYRIETATGQRFWIFRRLSDGRWFGHGAFE